MKNVIVMFFLILLFGVYSVSADFNLEVNEEAKAPIVFQEVNNPAIFDLHVTNNGEAEFAQIYSLVDLNLAPKGTFLIPNGKSVVEVTAYPGATWKEKEGWYAFEYNLKGDRGGEYKGKLLIQITSLKNALVLEEVKITPGDEKVKINLKNAVKSRIENIEVHFTSDFFDFTKEVSIDPLGEVVVEGDISGSKIQRLRAGPYTYEAEVGIGDAEVTLQGEINYLEKEGTSVLEESSGFIVRRNIITKQNEGNVPVTTTIEMKKDIVSRLFTTHSIEPTASERNGLSVKYLWETSLAPGQAFNVVSKTNYTLPFIVLLLVIVAVFVTSVFSVQPVSVHKRVSLVRTKGGQFALRAVLRVKARKSVDDAYLTDRIPHMVKLYEGFGKKPDHVDKDKRILGWNLQRLNKGEERILSYIIYSTLRTVGRFELPSALVSYSRDGEKKQVNSNKAYFVSGMSGEE